MKATQAIDVVMDPEHYPETMVTEAMDVLGKFRDTWGTTIDVLAESDPLEVVTSLLKWMAEKCASKPS